MNTNKQSGTFTIIAIVVIVLIAGAFGFYLIKGTSSPIDKSPQTVDESKPHVDVTPHEQDESKPHIDVTPHKQDESVPHDDVTPHPTNAERKPANTN